MSSPVLSTPVSRELFESLTSAALSTRRPGEHWVFSLISESSQFVRFNRARVRQGGLVQEAELSIKLVLEATGETKGLLRSCEGSLTLAGTLGGNEASMREEIEREMNRLRAEAPGLPADPYATVPQATQTSVAVRRAELLSPEFAAQTLITGMKDADLAGIYAAGTMVRATSTSAGSSHWFETDSFSFDYSLYTPAQKALKSLYAGQDWDAGGYTKQIEGDLLRLEALRRESKAVPRGPYRAYLAPQALAEIVNLLSYGVFSEGAIRQNKSPLRLLRSGEKSFSPLFSLSEDFSGGEVPRFNEEGELAPLTLPLIEQGKLIHTLISSRTAVEYGLTPNGAAESELLRSPQVAPGRSAEKAPFETTHEEEVLKRLGTGLYLSNLHYLNWSDVFKGRFTGMTRYACFWVENGKVVAPIQDLRFDDTIFNLLGSELEELTQNLVLIPETGTYEHRHLGAMRVPGALIRKFEFTL